MRPSLKKKSKPINKAKINQTNGKTGCSGGLEQETSAVHAVNQCDEQRRKDGRKTVSWLTGHEIVNVQLKVCNALECVQLGRFSCSLCLYKLNSKSLLGAIVKTLALLGM